MLKSWIRHCCALENGPDVYVNERQKMRHYRARSAEERRRRRRRRRKSAKSRFFFFARCLRKLALYSDDIYTLIRLQINHRIRWWCLKCVILYLSRDIPAFVMYCVYGESRSSLLIESTDYDIYTKITA